MADIFLSYDSQDRARVMPLIKVFKRKRWTVWWDRTIPPGETWDQVIGKALKEAKCVVVVWSEHAVDSDWVLDEAYEGRKRKILVPVVIDEVEMPLGFRRMQAARLVDWQAGMRTHPEIKILLEKIKKTLASSAPTGQPPATKEKAEPHARKPKTTEAVPAAEGAKKPSASARNGADGKDQDEGDG